MKFIRDIISEKRALKQATPVAPPSLPRTEEAIAEAEPLDGFRAAYDKAMRSVLPQEDAAEDIRNLFAQEPEPFEAPAEPAARMDPDAEAEDWSFDGAAAEAEAVEDDIWPEAEAPAEAPPAAEPMAPLYLDQVAQVAPAPTRHLSPFDRPKRPEAEREEPAPRRAAELFQRPERPEAIRVSMPEERPTPRFHAEELVPDRVPDRIADRVPDRPEDRRPQRDLSEMPFVSVRPAAQREEVAPEAGIQVPPPAAGRGSDRSGRVKTRLLGFNPDAIGVSDPFQKPESRAAEAFPVGWLVVVAGPGRGASFPLHDGVARIGRGEDQTVCLNFGDNSISRENHLSVAYDSEQNAFYIGQSGRSNIVRLNNKPLLSTEQIKGGDQIRVGETTLRLVALCDAGFSWGARA